MPLIAIYCQSVSQNAILAQNNNNKAVTMDDLPFIPVIYMHRMVDMLREEHIDTDHILRDTGISPALLNRPDTMLTARQARILIDKFMGLSSLTYPGVQFGKRLDLVTHGLLGFVFFWEGTFQDMITDIVAFIRVRFPLMRFELRQEPDYFGFRIRCDGRMREHEAFYIQTFVGSLYGLGSMLTQRMAIRCRKEIFKDLKQLQSILNADIAYTEDGVDEIRYYSSDIRFQSAGTRNTPDKKAVEGMEEHGFIVKLRTLILENLKKNAGAEEISSLMGMSVRTLRRRLADLGMSFNAIRTDVRMQIALRYLTTTSTSIERIADLVGYSDQTTFTRAFREWKGSTPNEIRQMRVQRDGEAIG